MSDTGICPRCGEDCFALYPVMTVYGQILEVCSDCESDLLDEYNTQEADDE